MERGGGFLNAPRREARPRCVDVFCRPVHFRGAAALRENTSRLLQPKNGALVCAPPPSDFLGPLLSMSNAPATNSPTSLVTQPVPDFTAAAVMPNNEIVEQFNLKSYLAGHYGLVFFYPLDFTFVCPSEILAHDHRLAQFKEKNVKVVAVSVDSHFTHLAWKNTPVDKGGLGQVQFPMVADITKDIARAFGVLLPGGVALRGTFLIDKAGIVQSAHINNLPLGRNVDEALRLVDALQFHEAHGEVCPANWQKGKPGMTASPKGVADYLAKNAGAL